MIYTEEQIYPFWAALDSHGFLSNWYKSPFETKCRFGSCDESKISVIEELPQDVRYCCAEQFLMAAKATLFGDIDSYERIMKTSSPREMKDFGRRVKGFDQDVWDANKATIMRFALHFKFEQNEELAEGLLLTGDRIIIEASPYDTVWGVGLGPNDKRLLNTDEWRGQNLLGECLMDARRALRDGIDRH